MKKLVVSLLAVVCLTGCMTGGPVIGPFSYLAANSNEKTMVKRAINQSQFIQPAQKSELFKAMAMGGDAQGYAVGVGIDLRALTDGQYTAAEAGKSLLGAIGDGLLYGGLAWGAGQITTSNSDSGKGNMTINGNVSDSQIQNYQGNTGTSGTGQSKPYLSENGTMRGE